MGPNRGAASVTPIDEPHSGLIIGVSPIGQMSCVPEGGSDVIHKRYIETLASFVAWLLAKGHRIAFCPTDFSQDQDFVEYIVASVRAKSSTVDVAGRIIKDPVYTTKDLITRMEMCDLVIASRFHAVVLPFALQKPVLAISYGRKMRDLMAACGQAAYHCELDKIDVKGLIELFQMLEQRREAIAQYLGVVVSHYRSRLDEQYEVVFGGAKRASQSMHGSAGERILSRRSCEWRELAWSVPQCRPAQI